MAIPPRSLAYILRRRMNTSEIRVKDTAGTYPLFTPNCRAKILSIKSVCTTNFATNALVVDVGTLADTDGIIDGGTANGGADNRTAGNVIDHTAEIIDPIVEAGVTVFTTYAQSTGPGALLFIVEWEPANLNDMEGNIR